MYDSYRIVQIFQDEPLDYKPSHFKLKGWTETIVGFIHEASKLSQCIVKNNRLMKRNYTWAVSNNIEQELSPHDIKEVWKKVCRKLKAKGVVALWVREPSRHNRCNYHLLVKSQITNFALAKAIEESMPTRSELPWHKQVEPVKSQWYWPRYICKAKTRATSTVAGWATNTERNVCCSSRISDYESVGRLVISGRNPRKKSGRLSSTKRSGLPKGWRNPKSGSWLIMCTSGWASMFRKRELNDHTATGLTLPAYVIGPTGCLAMRMNHRKTTGRY